MENMINKTKEPIQYKGNRYYIPGLADTIIAVAHLKIDVEEVSKSRSPSRAKDSPASIACAFSPGKDELLFLPKRSESPRIQERKRISSQLMDQNPCARPVDTKQCLFSTPSASKKARCSPEKPLSSGAYSPIGPAHR